MWETAEDKRGAARTAPPDHWSDEARGQAEAGAVGVGYCASPEVGEETVSHDPFEPFESDTGHIEDEVSTDDTVERRERALQVGPVLSAQDFVAGGRSVLPRLGPGLGTD